MQYIIGMPFAQVFADLYAVIAWMFETIRCRVDPKEAWVGGLLFSLKQRATQSWGVQKLCQAETDAAECEAATEARQMGLFMVVTGFSCNNTYCTV